MSGEIVRPEARDLDTLAAGIRREHEAVLGGIRTTLEAAVRCGKLLREAKDQIQHGGWGPWLGQHFPASLRTAQDYMRLAGRYPNARLPAHLTIDGALKQIATPRPVQVPPDDPEEADRVILRLNKNVGELTALIKRAGGLLYGSMPPEEAVKYLTEAERLIADVRAEAQEQSRDRAGEASE